MPSERKSCWSTLGRKSLSANLAVISAVVILGTLSGCGPRTEMAKEKLLKKIDGLLGESEVKRKQIAERITNMEQALRPLMEGKIKAKVEADQLQRKIDEIERKISDAKNSLTTIQTYLTSSQSVELAGKTYTPDDLNVQARKVIEAHKTLTTELKSMKEAHTKLLDRANVLTKRHDDAKRKLADMKSQVKQIDSNIASLEAMREARQAAGDGGATLAENFENLQDEINGLDAKIRTEIGIEDEEWKEVSAAEDVEDVSQFINATKGAEDTLSEIDAILGKSALE